MQSHDMTSIASISNEGRGNGATVATMQRRTKRSAAGKEANHKLRIDDCNDNDDDNKPHKPQLMTTTTPQSCIISS
jgi:hypothetical protein